MAGLRELGMLFQLHGLDGILNTLRYSLHRDRLDRRYRQAQAAHPSSAPRQPGALQETTRKPGGAVFRFEHACLEAHFLAPDLLCLSWEPGQPPLPYAIAKDDWPEVAVELEHAADGEILRSPALALRVGIDGSLEWHAPSGQRLRFAQPPEFSDGLEGPVWTEHCTLQDDERLYGLGERTGPLDWRGETRRMWNSDPHGAYKPGDDPIYMPLPIYLGQHSQGSYLVFYENPYPATFSSQARSIQPPAGTNVRPAPPDLVGNCLTSVFEGGMLRSYIIPGPLPQALERFSELIGRAPLPPRWALGYHQSRWSYKTAGEVRQVARGFLARELPLSAIHLDIDYMRGYRVFTVDPQRFPDLAGLAQELEDQGIRLVAILDPGVKRDPHYFVYQEGLERGIFCCQPNGKPLHGVVWPGWSAYPDFTNPEARQWWAGQYGRLLSQGIAGIWHDMNEPTSWAGWQGPYLPIDTRHHLEGCGGNHLQAHNLYALQMARAGFEGMRSQAPERRPWMITRAGWVSLARYTWNWSGDSHTSWESLRMVAAIVISCGLCGQPYNGPDIGGFSGDPNAELYLRWFQMAAFLPFFRTHSAFNTAAREPWSFGEPTTSIVRQFLRLRYRLMPYLYNLAWEASRSGAPLVRPLFWLNPQDERLWDRDDAFLLGNTLLVAPILEENARLRRVWLPEGAWYSLWDDTRYHGPAEVEISCGLEHIPVLVQAGSLLPLQDGDRLELHAYPPALPSTPSGRLSDAAEDAASRPLASLELYSDAGDGYGPSRLDHFTLRLNPANRLSVDWHGQGDFPFPYTRVELVLHGAPGRLEWGPAGGPPATNNRSR